MKWTPFLLLAACPFTSPTDDRECVDIEAEYTAEIDAVQTCTEAAECGQVLKGTSCGCTRNLVAREDADTTLLYALMDEAVGAQCDIGGTSVCDCPDAVGFDCVENRCTWNYVYDDPYLPQCYGANGDPISITAVTLDGTEIVADVTYSGGCAEHDIALCWPDQSFAESEPVQAFLELYHDGHDDACDGVLYEQVRFSLDPLIAAWQEAYQAQNGTITVHLGVHTVSLVF